MTYAHDSENYSDQPPVKTLNRHDLAQDLALYDLYIELGKAWREGMDIDLVSINILMVIFVSSNRTKAGDLISAAADGASLRPIARRRIAEATGFARETVRRKVDELVKNGWLESRRGGVILADPERLVGLDQSVGLSRSLRRLSTTLQPPKRDTRKAVSDVGAGVGQDVSDVMEMVAD